MRANKVKPNFKGLFQHVIRVTLKKGIILYVST